MRSSRTQTAGTKTNAPRTLQSVSPFELENKDPNYDYSFQRRREVEDGGGTTKDGWEIINHGNNSGERRAAPYFRSRNDAKTHGFRQIVVDDVVACRRHKDTSAFFKQREDMKYNAQKTMIRNTAKNARIKLRDIDPNAAVQDGVVSSDGFSQRAGPTEEAHDGES